MNIFSTFPMLKTIARQNLPMLDSAIINFLNTYPALPDEMGVTALLNVDDSAAVIIEIVALDDNCKVVRRIKSIRVSEFVEELLNKL